MPEIRLEHVTKRWGRFYGVDDLTLTIKDNAFVTLLGPSGCGKTTTLRMIAGLETPTSGRITIGDTVVFDSEKGINMPANKRKVGFLFQNYALWPNMTVYQNIAFGLSNIKEEMDTYSDEAREAARLVAALSSPANALAAIEDSRSKDGKVDEKKALVHLTESLLMPMSSAKKLYRILTSSKDYSGDIATLKATIDSARSKAEAAGGSLDDQYRIVKGGQVVRSVRKLTKDEIDLSVRRVSKLVKIGMFMDRYPAELSGGQQQRVAIARTLAPEPAVLFMDEPLSNLDAKLRLEMRYELQRLHVETGSTFVYVTHDQMEAMTLATDICLMSNAVLQQYAAPLDVYNRPANLFAADFVGNPSINFVEANGQQGGDGTVQLTLFDGMKATFRPASPLSLDEWRRQRDADAKAAEDALRAKSQMKGYVEKSNKDEVFHYHIQRTEEIDESLEGAKTIGDDDFVLGVRPELIEIDENGLPADRSHLRQQPLQDRDQDQDVDLERQDHALRQVVRTSCDARVACVLIGQIDNGFTASKVGLMPGLLSFHPPLVGDALQKPYGRHADGYVRI